MAVSIPAFLVFAFSFTKQTSHQQQLQQHGQPHKQARQTHPCNSSSRCRVLFIPVLHALQAQLLQLKTVSRRRSQLLLLVQLLLPRLQQQLQLLLLLLLLQQQLSQRRRAL